MSVWYRPQVDQFALLKGDLFTRILSNGNDFTFSGVTREFVEENGWIYIGEF